MNKILEVINSNKTMSEVFYSSSGGSTRFALRNLYNLFLSPLIITHDDGKMRENIEFNSNIFFQSFFCSEDHNEILYEENFVNILTIKRDYKSQESSLIKLRALNYINTNRVCKTEDFVSHLKSFGFSIDDILIVVNDFLNNKKSLIWSNERNRYDLKEIENIKGHYFFLTEMGEAYYDKLICYPSYLFECIHSLDGKQKSLTSSMNQLDELIKELFILDKEEIKTFCKRKSVTQYRNVYPLKEQPSILTILFFKMLPNYEFLGSKIPKSEFDIYGNYMVREVNSLLADIHFNKKNKQNPQ